MNYFKKLFRKKQYVEDEQFDFTKEEQFYMLFNNDFSKINRNKFGKTLDKVVTINLDEIISWLNFEELFIKYSYSSAGKKDGVWIENENDRYNILYQERGAVQWKNKKKSKNEIIDFYAKLIISIVPKHSHLNPL